MHLKYPHSKKFLTWEELSCLTSALGYPNGTLRNCIPDDHIIRKDGVSYREILKLIDLKYFNEALHLSVNMHTADYNINVLRKSMNLINHKFLTFDELSDVRVAFQVYEAGDMKGMIIDKHTLMRTLKLCGRTIAPLKLIHRVKHMEERLDEPGRIQFYEFLDLIVLCYLSKDVVVPDPRVGPMEKTWRKLFELDDFQRVFSTSDEKLEDQLNREFIGTERNYGHEILGSKRIPRESSVDPSLRKTQVRYHSRRYHELKSSLNKSTGQVQNTKAGHVRARPVSAPGIDQFRVPATPPPIFDTRPRTVAESTNSAHFSTTTRSLSARSDTLKSDADSIDPRIRLLQEIHDRKTLHSAPSSIQTAGLRFKPPPSMLPSAFPGGPGGDNENVLPWKQKKKQRKRTEKIVVTEENVKERQNILDSLQYEIETLEERTMQSLHFQLKELLPHHTFKSAALKRKEAEEIENARLAKIEEERMRRQKKREAKKAAIDSLEKLVHPNPRALSILHDRNCDARNQAFVGTRQDRRFPLAKSPAKPLLTLDGQKLANESEVSIRLDKNTLTGDNMSSAGSMEDTASSIAQTTDIVHHAGLLRQIRNTSQTPYDPTKFRESRMGTVALLHDYFHNSETASEGIDEGIGTMPPSTNKLDSRENESKAKNKDAEAQKEEPESDNPRRSISESGPRKSSVNSDEGKSKSRKPVSRRFRSPVAQNVQFERTKLTRKIQVGEEDELFLHGYPLSEIDRLTFKSGDEQVMGSNLLSDSLSDLNSKDGD
nr:uncharacterized protein LOC129268456 isoform X1 [Lytechinus pictus]XP_054761983.1 uncharacterized protein LOC129268456 isoform X1 [Lytechinus pictus]